MISSSLRLLVGLGNPGEKYKETRHNLGYTLVDKILERVSSSTCIHKSFRDFELWDCRIFGNSVFIQKPTTYMNLSGVAVAQLCGNEKIRPNEVLVIYDDLDLPLGKIRLRPSGGSGGHRGLESMIESLHSENFNRLRLGIGDKNTDREAKDFVLSVFQESELPIVERVLDQSLECVFASLIQGIEASMNKYNGIQLT